MYQEVLDVNLLGMIRVTQQFLPHLRQSKGRIVNASSAQGRFASPFSSAYSISKFGVEALGDTLRFELHKFGIKVIILEPGNFAKASAQFLPENMKKTMQRVWEQMSPELQKLYGKKYFNDVANAIAGTPDFSSPDLNMVIDDYIKALTLQSPKSRYMPATPLWKLIPLGLYFSPGWVGDFIFMSSLYLLKK
ncbi:D-beta-hydroxybutyrate dehydrogenase, mitochondrial [Holothuria leucospilota]|uniref:D-beta-hydroxybutyrate dehydrogenase, mitochondrial n=1 Tax=Holothuria leucospilota TaxID=206669 RepID=A0A9Q1CL19_HOLLE|nr:D-beta-hydroxybutyrate dehydrogenase, mitochondrial [Holothuria leucospilota]